MKKIAKLMTVLAMTAFTFTSCEDVPNPFGTVAPPDSQESIVVTPSGSGTATDPYNVAGVIEATKNLAAGETTTTDYYVSGYVVNVAQFNERYNSLSYYIADDEDGETDRFYVYSGSGLNGAAFSSVDDLPLGTHVTVRGKITNYNGTIEFQSQNTIVELNGETSGGNTEPVADAEGDGTLEKPYNIAGVIQYINTLGSDNNSPIQVYIKGKISEIKNEYVADNFGNATFYISDDGTTANQFYCYRTLYLGNEKYTAGKTQIKVGDDVIICGNVVNYRGNTPETVQNASYLYSLNGVTAGETPDTPQPGEAKGSGTEQDPFNVAAAVAKCQEVGETASTEKYYIKGIADADYTVSSYKNVEVDIVDTEGSAEKFKVFRVKDKDGKGIREGYKIAKGSTIIVYGPVVNYKGKTPETATGAYLVSVNGQAPELDGESGGNEQGGNEQGGGSEVSGNAITVVTADLGLGNQDKPTTLTLNDGTTLTFDGGGNTNAPAYYNTGTALRMYPKNTMTINAGTKTIVAIEIVCDNYNGTIYNASGDITVNNTKMTVSGDNLTFTGPNASTATVANVSETTGAPSQLRMKTITITYAK